MKKLIVILAVLGLIFGLVGTAMATDSDSHQVTITVSTINEIDVAGGDTPEPAVTLEIDTAVAGEEPTDSAPDTSTTLKWTTNAASKKITVQINLAYPEVTLTVEAIGSTAGTPVGVVTLSAVASNFITGMGKTKGSCTLQYIASATVAADPISYVYLVTYTITTS